VPIKHASVNDSHKASLDDRVRDRDVSHPAAAWPGNTLPDTDTPVGVLYDEPVCENVRDVPMVSLEKVLDLGRWKRR
jgi:hypothetical protein